MGKKTAKLFINLLVLILVSLLFNSSVKSDSDQEITINDDAFVSNFNKQENTVMKFSKSDKLIIGKFRHAYYKISLSDTVQEAETALLRIVKSHEGNTLVYNEAENYLRDVTKENTNSETEWTSDNITYNNRPLDIKESQQYEYNASSGEKNIELDIREILNSAIKAGKKQMTIHLTTKNVEDSTIGASEFYSIRSENKKPSIAAEFDDSKLTQRIQGENAIRKTGNVYVRNDDEIIPVNGIDDFKLSNAENGKFLDFSDYVKDISSFKNTIPEGQDTATWEINIPKSGVYQLAFKYNNLGTEWDGHRNARDERNMRVMINNENDFLSDEHWAGWMIFNVSGYNSGEMTQTTVHSKETISGNTTWNNNYMNVYLDKGRNTITLGIQAPPGQAVYDGPNLDYFDVTYIDNQYVKANEIPYISNDFKFQHPGIYYTTADLERIKLNKNNLETVEGKGYKEILESDLSKVTYIPQINEKNITEIDVGPYNNPNKGGSEYTKDGSAAHYNALRWYMDGTTDNAKKAIEILNAWSTNLKTVADGNDLKLRFSIVGPDFINAAEILKNIYNEDPNVAESDKWQPADIEKFDQFVRNKLLAKTMSYYPQANGNWDALIGSFNMAAAVYLEDTKLFNDALTQFYLGNLTGDNVSSMGSLLNYVSETGESQESNRDQIHARMGLSGLAYQSEIAWNQGIDLYGAYDSRLLLGTQYSANYMLGETVDSKTFISDKSRGVNNIASMVYEIIGNHYTNETNSSVDLKNINSATKFLRDGVKNEASQNASYFGAMIFQGDANSGSDEITSNNIGNYLTNTALPIKYFKIKYQDNEITKYIKVDQDGSLSETDQSQEAETFALFVSNSVFSIEGKLETNYAIKSTTNNKFLTIQNYFNAEDKNKNYYNLSDNIYQIKATASEVNYNERFKVQYYPERQKYTIQTHLNTLRDDNQEKYFIDHGNLGLTASNANKNSIDYSFEETTFAGQLEVDTQVVGDNLQVTWRSVDNDFDLSHYKINNKQVDVVQLSDNHFLQAVIPLTSVSDKMTLSYQNDGQILVSEQSIRTFKHPGVQLTTQSLDEMKSHIVAKEEPWYSDYLKLKNTVPNQLSSSNYSVTVYEGIGRGTPEGHGNIDSFEQSSSAAYFNALQWVITGDESFAKKATEIINSWSSTLKVLDGRDRILGASINGSKFVNAAEILANYNGGYTNYTAENISTTQEMLINVLYPVIEDLGSPMIANGNWDTAAMDAMISIGVFTNNTKIYERAISLYQDIHVNGSIAVYVSDWGQSVESARDQAHAQLGIGYLATTSQVAYNQGDDLFSLFDNRLAKAFEWAAKYNLYQDVQFEPLMNVFQDSSRGYWTYLDSEKINRGELRPVYELPLAHYSKIGGVDITWTAKAAEAMRSEGLVHYDNLNFSTLTLYNGSTVSNVQDVFPYFRLRTRIEPWYQRTLTKVNGEFVYETLNSYFSSSKSGVTAMSQRKNADLYQLVRNTDETYSIWNVTQQKYLSIKENESDADGNLLVRADARQITDTEKFKFMSTGVGFNYFSSPKFGNRLLFTDVEGSDDPNTANLTLKLGKKVTDDFTSVANEERFIINYIDRETAQKSIPKADKIALQELYDANQAKEQGNYTDESWSAFVTALSAAKTLLSSDSVTQLEIDSAKADLTAAISGLVEKSATVDKTALQELYDTNKDKLQGDYTDSSWAVFTEELKKAEVILAKESATQTEVDSAKTALEIAIDGLVDKEVVDKTALQSLYDTNKDKLQGDYTDASWAVFKTSLSAAKSILSSEAVSQLEVNNAKNALEEAVSGLVDKENVDKTALQSLYDANQAKEQGNYTDESWSAFVTALSAAKTLLSSDSVTQSEIDSAKADLTTAISNLVEKSATVDKTALQELYDANQAKEQSNYTDESWSAFVTALSAAKTLLSSDSVTQSEIDSAKADLTAAISNLVEKSVTVDKTALQELYDANQAKEQGNYTDESWSAFVTALSAAKTSLSSDSVTQSEIDSAKVDLTAAISGLVEKSVTVDKTALQELYDANQAKEQGNYTDESWSAFVTVLSAAKTLLSSDSVTQLEIDNAKVDLAAAISGLVEKTSKEQEERDKSKQFQDQLGNQSKNSSSGRSSQRLLNTSELRRPIMMIIGGLLLVFSLVMMVYQKKQRSSNQ